MKAQTTNDGVLLVAENTKENILLHLLSENLNPKGCYPYLTIQMDEGYMKESNQIIEAITRNAVEAKNEV